MKLKATNKLLRNWIAALRDLGTGITRNAHEPHRNIRCRSYLGGMWLRHNLKVSLRRNSLCSFSRSPHSVRLALQRLATVLRGFSTSFILLTLLCYSCQTEADQTSFPELVIGDIRHVIGAPARWDETEWHQAGWVTLGILGTAAIVDRPLQDEMRRHAPNNNSAILQVERLGAQYSVGVLGGFYLAGVTGNETAAEVAQDGLAASLIASGLVTPSIKLVVGRSRPRANAGIANFKPFSDPNASFPSGHTTEAFALASVIANHYDERWVQYSAYSLAGLVGVARSYHDAHFASDILTGALIGTLVGQSVVTHNRTLRAAKIAVLPDLTAGQVGVRVVGNF